MIKKWYGVMIVALMCTGSMLSCRHESQESVSSFERRHDIVQELQSLLQIPAIKATQVISFAKTDNPAPYLVQGWSAPEPDFIWANGLSSTLRFWSYNADKELEIEKICRAIPSLDQRPQITMVLLNGENIGNIEIQRMRGASLWHKVTLPLPQRYLCSGENRLQFNFTYTTKPQQLWPISPNDSRDLAVNFQKITFHQIR
jgi:hypothetical protein